MTDAQMEETTVTRNLWQAKEAFHTQNPEESRLAHSCPCICEPGHKTYAAPVGIRKYVKECELSATQGLIIGCALVAFITAMEAVAANYAMGLVFLFAIALTMGIFTKINKQAEMDFFESERRRENWECENYLEGEQREMVELYVSKGMNPEDAETVVRLLSKNQKMFVDIMMVEELGLMPHHHELSPLQRGFLAFFGFFVSSSIPMLAFLACYNYWYNGPAAFQASFCIASGTLFAYSYVKHKLFIDLKAWWKQCVQMVIVQSIIVAFTVSCASYLHEREALFLLNPIMA